MSAASAAAAAAATAATATATQRNQRNQTISTWEINNTSVHHHQSPAAPSHNRYETQKRRDWNIFRQYLHHHTPPVGLFECSGAHVIEFLDQIGNNKVHNEDCSLIGSPDTAASSCPCPLRDAAWASLNGLIGRLSVAYGDNSGLAEKNPFDERIVQLYLREVKENQAKARGKKHHEMMGGRRPP